MSVLSGVPLTLLQLLCLEARNVAPANIVLSQIDSRLELRRTGNVTKIPLMQAEQVESLNFLYYA